jgi:hypothetical protein
MRIPCPPCRCCTANTNVLARSEEGQLRLPQPVQRCVPLLPLYPRIADQVDAQVKVVGLVPICDSCSAANAEILHYLVGTGEQRGRDGEPNRVCSLHIIKQLELCCLIDWNVPRRCAIKDLSNTEPLHEGGLAALQTMLSPFNLWNFVAVVLTLAPGFLLIRLGDWIMARRPRQPQS